MQFVAVSAFLESVISREGFPMPFLADCEDTRASAQRAAIFQRCQNGFADELRPVVNPPHRLRQSGINLERDNLALLLRHVPSTSWLVGATKYHVTSAGFQHDTRGFDLLSSGTIVQQNRLVPENGQQHAGESETFAG